MPARVVAVCLDGAATLEVRLVEGRALSGVSYDPAQLFRLRAGELPGLPHKCGLRDRRPSIHLHWDMLAMKLWGVCRFIVRRGVSRSRQGNNDLLTLHFDVKVLDGSMMPSSL